MKKVAGIEQLDDGRYAIVFGSFIEARRCLVRIRRALRQEHEHPKKAQQKAAGSLNRMKQR